MSQIVWHEELPSTMPEAARWANEGAPHGSVVAARKQTAGQGRHGRRWESEAGTGLYFTEILRVRAAAADLPVITLALGLAVAEALTQVSGLAMDLRWPNDVLLDGRKVCGILTQLEQSAVLAGIGVNLNQREFPPEIAAVATSLWLACGREFRADEMLAEILPRIDFYAALLEREGRQPILRLFERSSSYAMGRRVQVDLGGRVLQGVTDGLDELGFLRVRKEDGTQELVLAGGVRPWV